LTTIVVKPARFEAYYSVREAGIVEEPKDM